MKQIIIIFASIIAFICIGCDNTIDVGASKEKSIINFKFSKFHTISFYAYYPDRTIDVIADCYCLPNSCNWLLRFRRINTKGNNVGIDEINTVISDMCSQVQNFLNRHHFKKGIIGTLEIPLYFYASLESYAFEKGAMPGDEPPCLQSLRKILKNKQMDFDLASFYLSDTPLPNTGMIRMKMKSNIKIEVQQHS